MRYIYGPVKSRRLGLSLGLSLTPYKVCSFDCVYCQLGRTTFNTAKRTECVPVSDIIAELRLWLENNPSEAKNLDYITFSGFGEPTLNSKLGELIVEVKKITPTAVAVLTNAALLKDPQVRLELSWADLIVPSLDAASQKAFEKIDRPGAGIKIEDIIEGLVALRKEFTKKIWLEIMLVRGINDNSGEAKKLKEAVERINPDKIQLNSPVRGTTEVAALPADKKMLEKVKDILGAKCEIV